MEIWSEGAEALGPDRGRLVCPWDLVAAVSFLLLMATLFSLTMVLRLRVVRLVLVKCLPL